MNYFEFYGIPESFHPDQVVVKKKFYELSKKYHPDFYIAETDVKQDEVLQLSTINNKAFQVLNNRLKLTDYILREHHLLADGDKYPLAPDFLMEMMEINEQFTDAEDEQTVNAIKASVKEASAQLDQEQETITSDFEAKLPEEKEIALKKVLDIYYRRKYLLRIQQSLDTFAAR